MIYLFDTCAISEFILPAPNPKVIQALSSILDEDAGISAMSIGEVLFGIERLPQGARKQRYTRWYNDWLIPAFAGRIMPMDFAVMQRWGKLVADNEGAGWTMEVEDSLIGAVALTHDLTVVTRNSKDFAHSGVRIYDPWKE